MDHRRRRLLRLLASLPLAAALPAPARDGMAFGLTPVILDDQLGFLNQWKQWFEARLHTRLTFVQRLKYRDITDALLDEQLDAAWVCGYPYVRNRPYMELVAVPVYGGKPTYHSFIIRNHRLEGIQRIQQLKGRVFAYSDPDSNSGYLYPTYRFYQLGIRPQRFFRKTFFTWAHRNTVDAVASGLADAGAVDSYIWEQYRVHHPEVVRNTVVIERSPAFAFPPIVVRNTLPQSKKQQLQRILTGMTGDLQGRLLLRELGLDGFTPGSDALFAGIEGMWKTLSAHLGWLRQT